MTRFWFYDIQNIVILSETLNSKKRYGFNGHETIQHYTKTSIQVKEQRSSTMSETHTLKWVWNGP